MRKKRYTLLVRAVANAFNQPEHKADKELKTLTNKELELLIRHPRVQAYFNSIRLFDFI